MEIGPLTELLSHRHIACKRINSSPVRDAVLWRIEENMPFYFTIESNVFCIHTQRLHKLLINGIHRRRRPDRT